MDESKVEILKRLRDAGAPVAPFAVIENRWSLEEKLVQVKAAMVSWQADFPIVLKPEHGERGKGVVIVKTDESLKETLASTVDTLIVQKFVPGIEFGVLYWRYPNSAGGNISSITRKIYTSVTGDGVSTLEHLILHDSRAICSAATFLKCHADELYRVPAKGEVVKLVEIGTHARGSLFLDNNHLKTDALLKRMDEISVPVSGYYLGRFDLKVPDEQSLQKGEQIQIVELNLLSSEPTHMYDPKHSLFYGWKALMFHWKTAFEIGDQVRATGGKPLGAVAFARKLWQHYVQ